MKILRCTCKHPFQDSLYGIGNRAMNETKSGQYRCTVCSSLVGSQFGAATPTKVEKAPQPKPAEKTPVKDQPKKADEKSTEKKSKKPSLKGGKR